MAYTPEEQAAIMHVREWHRQMMEYHEHQKQFHASRLSELNLPGVEEHSKEESATEDAGIMNRKNMRRKARRR